MIKGQYRKERQIMKTALRIFTIAILMVLAAPAYSDAIQMFNCQLTDDATTDDVLDMSAKWLKVAKTMKGGENLKVFVRHPIAASSDDVDFVFVVTVPTFAEWGAFTDAYEVTDMIAAIDDEYEKVADCNDSAIWEGAEIE